MNREGTINNGQAYNPEDNVTDDTRHYGNPEGEDTATGETADPDPIVAVEPEVEILGVEVVHTDEGDVTLGGISVNGEEYVLVDVDGGDFDAAWHDDNHDHQVQESEIIDISDEHISVEGFTELAEQQEHPMEDIPASTSEVAPHDDLLALDDIDPMVPGETDYMVETDDSGLV